MAELFSFFAEEINRAITMVWGGVAIASELNYRLMSIIVTSTSRIVQLLFLLTQKVTDVFSIIGGDILLFIGDIGNGTMAFFHLYWSFATSMKAVILAMLTGVWNSVCYLFDLIYSLFNAVICFVIAFQENVCVAFSMLQDIVILFGSSVIFIITFIPKLVLLLICEAISAVQNLHTVFRATVLNVFSDSKLALEQVLDSFIYCFSHISLEALVGLAFGILAVVVIKMSYTYFKNTMVRMPEIGLPSYITHLKRTTFNWYSRIWNEGNMEPAVEYNADVNRVDNGSDENGNDSNQNIPDRNLEREVIPAPVVRPTNNTIHLVRRPLTRYQRRIGQEREFSDDEIAARRKTPSKRLHSHTTSSSFDNVADELQKQLEEERDNQLCAVCQDRKRNIILLPCRHLCLCSYCSLSIFRTNKPCPICRNVVTETLKVYL